MTDPLTQPHHTLKAVLFDLDDTLFDHLYAARCGAAALYADHPVLSRRPLDELCAEQYRLLNEVHHRVLLGELTLEAARAERWRRLIDWCGGTVTEEEAFDLARRYREAYLAHQRVVSGGVSLLKALKDRVRIGIVTNNLTDEQWGKLRSLGLEDHIDFMVTSEEVGEPKPAPAIFCAALDRAPCRPEEAVMIGDSWEIDVLGARSAGLRTLWFNPRRLPCPDPSLCVPELVCYEPTEEVLRLIAAGS